MEDKPDAKSDGRPAEAVSGREMREAAEALADRKGLVPKGEGEWAIVDGFLCYRRRLK